MTRELKSLRTFVGMVLCGGRSTRMGQPKAWLSFRGETFLERITRTLAHVVPQVMVVAADGQELPKLIANCEIVRDLVPDEGPLRGIFSGLTQVKHAASAVLVTSCDMPLISTEVCQWLINEFEREATDALCPVINGIWQPMMSIYSSATMGHMETALHEGQRSLKAVLQRVQTRFVDVPPELVPCLRNINTPEDYQQLS